MQEAQGLPQLLADGTRRLTAADLEAVSTPIDVVLSEAVRSRVAECERFVVSAAASGRPVYGLTTGYGPLVAYGSNPDPGANSRGLVSFLQASQGPPLPEPIVRAMLLARIWSLSADVPASTCPHSRPWLGHSARGSPRWFRSWARSGPAETCPPWPTPPARSWGWVRHSSMASVCPPSTP